MLRLQLCLAALLSAGATVSTLIGQPSASTGPGVAAAAPALPPELQAELDALQRGTWHASATTRAAVGWRDNVLLSPFAPIERTFGRAELEAMLWRPMRNEWEVLSFLNGDVLRYFSPPRETGGEQQWSLHGEGRWQPIEPLRLSLKATSYLSDLVIDLSETETMRVVAPTRVRGGYAAAVTRLRLPAGFTLEPLGQVKRTDYRDYPGDYDETRAGARLEWQRSRAFAISIAGFAQRRRYAEREQYSAGGRALPGTRLRFFQRDAEAKLRSGFDAAGEWTIGVAAGRVENRDRASGYFDYDQKRARLEVTWRRERWSVLLDAAAKRLDYRGQTVGSGIAPPPRITDDFDTTLRVERELDARWLWFAEHRWERSRSNEIGFNYGANTVLAGAQRSF